MMKHIMMYPCTCLLVISLCVVVMVMSGNDGRKRREDHHGDTGYSGVASNASEPCNEYEQRVGCDAKPLCFCDKLCEKFNDCCHSSMLDQTREDFSPSSQGIVGNGNHSNSIPSDMFSNAAYHVCVELPSSFKNKIYQVLFKNEYTLPNGYWLVGKCPQSWNDVSTKHLCEAPAESNLMLHLPVVSSDDNMTSFRNIYCAVCHRVPLTKIKSWKISTNVIFDPTLGSANASAGILTSFKGFDRMKNVKFDPSLTEVRMCLKNVVDGCPADYKDDHAIEACRSYMAAVVHPTSHVIYRNWYCALCNDAIDPELVICGSFKLIPISVFSTPLTALVDLQGTRISLQDINKEIENTCGRNEFLDPFSLRCRALLCPPGLRLVNGTCVMPVLSGEPTGITDRNCTSPGHVQLEVDICLAEDTSDPCELWKECFGFQTSPSTPVWSTGWCETERGGDLALKMKGELSCAPLARIRFILNTTAQVVDYALKEILTENLIKRCPSVVSVPEVVVKKGCLPSPHTKCLHDYHSENDSNVYLTSWNNFETLYLRDHNAFYSLEETHYQIKYNPSSEGPLNITQSVTLCGNPIDPINCSLVAVNSSEFAQLLSVEDTPLSDENHVILESGGALVCRHLVSTLPTEPKRVTGDTIVTLIGIIVSMLALVASFITYVVFPNLRNLPGRCVMSLIVAVFSAQLLLLITGDDVARSVGKASCAALAVLLHYTCLLTFSWTNTLAFYLARTLGPGAKPSAASQHRNSFLYFSLFGWGVPLVIILICLVLHFIPNLGLTYGVSVSNAGIRSCSIVDEGMEIAAFVVPISVSLLANVVLFVTILVGFTFRKAPSTNLCSKEARTIRVRRDALITIKVGFLLAFTWIFGFLATGFQSEVLLYVFCIMTSLQGVYIFLAFTFTQQVRALWREKLGLKRPEPSSRKATQKKYFQKPKKVVSATTDKKDLCRKYSPSEHQTADSARNDMVKNADIV